MIVKIANRLKSWMSFIEVSFLVVAILVTASGFALSTDAAQAQSRKKSSCISGETSRVARYKIKRGKILPASIDRPLNGKRGNAEKGVEWMVTRRQGNCISCHMVTKILKRVKNGDLGSEEKYGFHGDFAPPLDGVADRYSEGELRMIVVDAKKAFPDTNTSMPAYHRKDGFERVLDDCKGLAILSAGRVEDIVAFLKTLNESEELN